MYCIKIIKRILVTTFCLITTLLHLHALDIHDWEREIKKINNNISLSDSSKIIEISNLTSSYYIYYKAINEETIPKFLTFTLPLAEKLSTEEVYVNIYTTALLLTKETQDKGEYTEKSLHYIQNSNVYETRHLGWMNMGKANMGKAIALNYFFNALNEVKGKSALLESKAYEFITYYYGLQGNHKNQLKYASLALEKALESDDKRQMMIAWKDLGAAYYETSGNPQVDEALDAYEEARKLSEESIKNKNALIGSIEYLHHMEIVVTLGSLYQDKNEMSAALRYMNEALTIATENNLPETRAFCHKQLGIIYQHIGNYSRAEKEYLRAENILSTDYLRTQESEHIDYEVKLQLATLYKITGHFDASAAYYRAGFEQYRQVFDEEIIAENQNMTAFYEAKKKEEDIASLQAIIELKDKQKYYYYAIFLALLAILTIVFRLYHYKLTTLKQNEIRLRNETKMLELAKKRLNCKPGLKTKRRSIYAKN